MKKNVLRILATSMLVITTLGFVGCSSTKEGGDKGEVKKLSFAVNFSANDTTYQNLEAIIKDFEAQNKDIDIELSNIPDYENAMKTKMGANQLPDIWSTHGWSVARYSEYLLPLQEQPWVSKLNPLVKEVITNEKGELFVLPMDYDVAGVAFNKDVLDEAGVNPDDIKTWDDFKAACEKIKAKGKVPVYIGGSKDDWTVGNFFDWVAPSFLITNQNKNYAKELKDGSFDWSNWNQVAQLLVDFQEAGYINKNVNEGTWAEVGEQLGKGNAAFAFFGNYVISEAMKFNKDANYGFMPIPAASKDDKPSLITGERSAFGIWKDTKYKDEAIKFLTFLSEPKNVNKIASGNLAPTGLVGDEYKTEAGGLTEYFEKNNNGTIPGFPYFDRAYLPSGMWESLCKTGTGLLAGTMNVDDASNKMKDDYSKLMKK